MKKLSIILVISLLFSVLSVKAFAGSDRLVLASRGKTDYAIVYSQNASEVEITAAETLEKYLEQISGADFVLTDDTARVRNNEIRVGKTNREPEELGIDRDSLGDEGVRILVFNGYLYIAGGEKRGVLYAVYTFLEDYLGCRWFTDKLIVIPKNDIVCVSADIDYTYVPCFALRQTYWRFSTTDTEYSVANKLNVGFAEYPEAVGGNASENAIYGCHSLDAICPDALFNEHPEYFGCNENGERSTDCQPCLSSPEVLALAIEYAENIFAANPDVKILSISQKDCRGACVCEKCAAYDAAHGGQQSASLINFVNQVAKAVAENYPDCFIETFAYQYSQTPPENIVIEKNVIIRICNISTCVLHNLDDESCYSNAVFNSDMKGWAALTDNMYMWTYSTNFRYFYSMHANIGTLKARYQYYRDNKCIGIFEQGIGEDIVPAELHDLRTYIVTKLLWDPDADVDMYINEFCDAYYGEAGADVVEFITTFEKAVKGFNIRYNTESHMSCGEAGLFLGRSSSANEFDICTLNAILNRASEKNLAPEQEHNLYGFIMSWRFFKCATRSGEFNYFSPFADPLEQLQLLFDDMKDYGIKYLGESGGGALRDYYPNFANRPSDWYTDGSNLNSTEKAEVIILPVINAILRFFSGYLIFHAVFMQCST